MVADVNIPVATLRQAAGRREVVAVMAEFLAEADRRIAEHHPTCRNRGHCCRFGEFGHRLYVTALEVVYYLAMAGHNGGAVVIDDACPHCRGGRCTARDGRPLGCRIFYCDPAASEFQAPLTEEMLRRLRQLHHRLGVPYFYADWLNVLRTLENQS